MTVIDIRNLIVLKDFNFTISILRRFNSLNSIFDGKDSSAVNLLKQYVYENEDSEDEFEEEKLILDYLDQYKQIKLIKFYLETYPYFELPSN